MKKSMKFLVTMLFLISAWNVQCQEIGTEFLKTKKDVQKKHTISAFYNNTWILLNEVGLQYEYQLNEKYAINAGYGTMAIFYDKIYLNQRARTGVKYFFSGRELENGASSTGFAELEGSVLIKDKLGIGMFRIGWEIAFIDNFVFGLAGGAGLLRALDQSRAGEFEGVAFAPMIDGYFKIGYQF